ncbi:RNA polymerase, sigma-24 subunit, ECF subfamily (plasmid) [Novosphingobium aromaticivorans DSM 12444]|jgi:RNA polymerase sigma factor (sigma-70 family)|uniref:RNA polymerase, sigma-24 subunit, ECF subfamily n=2 Tax=Novosphingobium aromaticivorans TaxID=48935 RepID=A4XE42_NOVAD|nr:sigma-70 family RNA polymerase sigma factor [Novosphingobium aromaticivorans]AAD03915.1 RNA polymerase signa E (sigma 24) [Novosphingobium aromaticivorans]ABP64203.1 RNA polymerase, sigma-24 subunit, ECF subfamily [Novosphingobium aromaticivorans DSM 12444]SCY96748.1 RNA polymerase sigma factor, sigma-70 family [Novosphingobium aromaticivorans]
MGNRQQSETSRGELILAAQGGDSVAIGRLLASCQNDIRRYARRHCAASDIDDAVQETLLVITRKVASLRAAAAFTGWLFTVIRRECQRLARAMLSQGAEPLDVAEQRICTLPDETLRLDVAAALESLPAHYLEVILLRDFEELTIAEIAGRLHEPAGAIKSRLHRARALVREYLSHEAATP